MFKLLFLLFSGILFAQENVNKLSLQNSEFSKEVNFLTSHFESRFITVSELAKLMASKNEIVLLDAREKNEFAVSHISTAINIGYESIDFDHLIKSIDKKKKVIIYCSVGYRSGKIADQFKKRGFDVFNLYGGLFEWSNEKKQLVDSFGKTTNRIHTFNKKWSKWVRFGEKVY
jgi:rhodanese-related sulfurtransferase